MKKKKTKTEKSWMHSNKGWRLELYQEGRKIGYKFYYKNMYKEKV